MKRSPQARRLLCFWVFLGALAGSMVYSRAVRRVALGDEFQYVPRENVLLVATGDIESLWAAASEHLGAASQKVGGGSQEDLDDLIEMGLDVKRGMLLSLHRARPKDDYLIVLPVKDRNALSKEFCANAAPAKDPISDAHSDLPYDVSDCGEKHFLSFPQPDLAVFSNSFEQMRRSLSFRRENLAHAAGNDKLYEAIRRTARGPLLVGAKVFVYWQSRTAPFGERSAVLRLDREQLRFEADIELADGPVLMAENLLQPEREDDGWARQLPKDTLGLILMQDRNLASYRPFLVNELLPYVRTKDLFEGQLKEWLEGADLEDYEQLSIYKEFIADQLFPELFGIAGSDRLVLAVTDIEAGLPNLLVGVWGNRTALDNAIRNLQQSLRRKRDLQLLSQARTEYLRQTGKVPTLAQLQKLELLEPERNSLFERYQLLPDRIGDPEFHRWDFANDSYLGDIDGQGIFFLTPPVTDNDLKHMPDLDEEDRKALLDGRFRVAALRQGNALWIATNIDDLREVIARAKGEGDSLQQNPAYQRASAEWKGGAKLQVFLDVDGIIARSQLQPGSDLESLVDKKLAKYPIYASFGLRAAPSGDRRRLAIDANLRRSALE